MLRFIIGTIRLLIFIPLTLDAVLIGLIGGIFTKHPSKFYFKVLQLWTRIIMPVLGVEQEIQGEFPEESMLIVPNHRSYTDLLAITGRKTAVFVAKASVRKWPLIGWGGRLLDTIFVERDSKASRHKTLEEIQKRLENDQSVVVFPEGTTTLGPGINELRPRTFIMAAGKIPILPVAIEFKHQRDAFIGNDTFIPHFIRTFGKWKTPMKIRIGEPLMEGDGIELRDKTAVWLTENLEEMRAEFDAE